MRPTTDGLVPINMTEPPDGTAAVVTEKTCAICLEDSQDPLRLPCGHSFCDGCLDEWRSRYGVEEEMRRRCPTCRAKIPPSKEMVTTMLTWRARKKQYEDKNHTTSVGYHNTCQLLKEAEERIGEDWDGVTVLQDNTDEPAVVMPNYVSKAIARGEIKSVLKWINANRTEDRVNAISNAEWGSMPALMTASIQDQLTLMTVLLQLGADVHSRDCQGNTTIGFMINGDTFLRGDPNKRVRLLLSWGAGFFPKDGQSRECCISAARQYGHLELVNLVASELGGRRCEIINFSSQPDLNGETCIADEYLPTSDQYKVMLESKHKEVLVLSPDNLKRRDRTPQDCGYHIEFKNGRTIRHDFDSSEDCQAFVAALRRGESQPVVTEEAEARAEQAAAELLAELGLDDSPNKTSNSVDKAKRSKKKKGGKMKKKK